MSILGCERRPPRLRALVWLVVAAPLALPGALAQEPSPALSSIVYVPHDFNAPLVTTAGGTRHADAPPGPDDTAVPGPLVRGVGPRGGQASPPAVLVLAPPRQALTLSPQPTLYWYLSGPSPAPVRVTLLAEAGAAPLLEIRLAAGARGGVHATSLEEHGARLEPGELYRWSVALEVDPGAPSKEPLAQTVLATAPDPRLRARLERVSALEQAKSLALAGYWYDAIDVISRQIDAGDTAAPWRELRAALLEQVGLGAVAAQDRAGGRAQ